MHSARHRHVSFRLTKARALVATTVAVVCVPLAVVAGSAVSASSPSSAAAKSPSHVSKALKPPSLATVKADLKAQLKKYGKPTPAKPLVSTVKHLSASVQASKADKRGNVPVALKGDRTQLIAAVHKLGGQVLASTSGTVSAVVAKKSLTNLAGSAGVTAVDKPISAVTTSVVSQGVGASNATAWQTAYQGRAGAGVTVGIVDAGYGNLNAEVAAGRLPAGLTVSSLSPGQPGCSDVNGTEHGTAVAEIVHQMAPGAKLVLYCVEDTVGFAQAGANLAALGVKIVNSSLGFPGDGRGDGTGISQTAVQTARQRGVLWIESAGNNASDHWSGNLTDTSPHNNLADLDGAGAEADAFRVAAYGSALVVLNWDQWNGAITPGMGVTLTPQGGNPITIGESGTDPVIYVEVPGSAADTTWTVSIVMPNGMPGVAYDLSYWGDVSSSMLSQVNGAYAGRAAYRSVTAPADSPYAMAVGAANVRSRALEYYSSQGPTLDGRIKPDITGYDCVQSNLDEFAPSPNPASPYTGFCGTSAAAPNVAGAAALALSQSPTLSAPQLAAYLEQSAGTYPPTNNQIGSGLVNLPSPGAGYTPLAAPLRVRDTRTKAPANQGPRGKVAAGHVIDFNVSGVAQGVAAVPATATAVAINVTATGANVSGAVSVVPGDSYANGQAIARPATSTLNTSVKDSTTAGFAIVTISAAQRIAVYNGGGTVDIVVDVLGYFSPTSTGHYAALASSRPLDTRGMGGQMPNGSVRPVNVSSVVPAGATAAVVNVTATGQRSSGYLAVSPSCPATANNVSTSTLNYLGNRPARSNLAVVGLTNGAFCVFNAGGPVQAIVDVIGYISPSATAKYVALPAPARDLDTRGTVGGHKAQLGPKTAMTLAVGGVNGVPANAVAVASSVVAVNPTSASFLEVYPNGSALPPAASTVNFGANQNVPNADTANLGSGGVVRIYNQGGRLDVVMDVSGFFIG
jgi:hypothetical protein